MGSVAIDIPDREEVAVKEKKWKTTGSVIRVMKSKVDARKLIHSVKVGTALVLVSLLYLLDPLYEQVGENAMWAIMTVVVIFEFFAGATLKKGLNRGIGTILGGGLGCLAAAFAQEVGGIGNSIIVGTSVFIFGAAATYSRLIPSIKKRYDYGAMIFILTFNLVVVSGIRADEVLELARVRLTTIIMGFAVCIIISLCVFPIWASDDFHHSTASKFKDLAATIEGCMQEYFKVMSEKENQASFNFNSCKSLLHSKSKDESLVDFARWEPWRGKFGYSYPWEKYLQIAEVLRDLAVTVLSLKGCLNSSAQFSEIERQSIKEPCEAIGTSLASILRELGESFMNMGRCQAEVLMVPKLKAMRVELSQVMPASKLGQLESCDGLATASFVFSLMKILEKVDELAKQVEELGALAGFRAK